MDLWEDRTILAPNTRHPATQVGEQLCLLQNPLLSLYGKQAAFPSTENVPSPATLPLQAVGITGGICAPEQLFELLPHTLVARNTVHKLAI